ncbi:MAG TPA: Rhs element Vgr protein [Ideonella sp.]|uniref:Rhs element Vgr protein n=1 Tax=Ideonella sp. TaxID=1929293 RepID=UPI002BBA6530|nr:Rhs element Vgr protein [Ideonella sp.]HSI49054.1 Rhs element Vgr protein [Ideonella sp.]
MAGQRIPGATSPTLREPAGWGEPFDLRSALPGPTGLVATGIGAGLDGLPDKRGQSPRPQVQPVRRPTPEGESRGLTVNERDMARTLFGNSVDYNRVKVHNEEYLWFGLQPDDTAMTPNGEMYFNPKHFKEDFALAGFSDSLWFMHEMVHVWQHQLGYPVMLRGAIRIGLGYDYTLDAKKTLGDCNMEAQGDLLSDYWAVKNFSHPPEMHQSKHINDRALFETVLRLFIANPSDKRNLP